MIKYNKPDLNAPRYRYKSHSILNKDFCNKIKEKGKEYKDLSNEEIKNVIKIFNQKIWESVIECRDGVELLEQLGYMFIGTCKKKKFNNPDVEKSLEHGVQIQHQNWESDQYLAKIFYTNYETKYKFKFHELWGFEALRDFKRTVSKTYPTEWKKYIVVDNMVRVSRLFRKSLYVDKVKQETEIAFETYNEFDMN